jgi:MFS family permease
MTPKQAVTAMIGPFLGFAIGGALLASTGSLNWGWVLGALVGLVIGPIFLLLLRSLARLRHPPAA